MWLGRVGTGRWAWHFLQQGSVVRPIHHLSIIHHASCIVSSRSAPIQSNRIRPWHVLAWHTWPCLLV